MRFCAIATGLSHKLFVLIIVIAFLSGGLKLFAQKTDPTGDEKWARAYISAGDFITAMKEYQLLIKKDSLNTEYNYNLGTCYLNTNIDKSKAVPYIEYASQQTKIDPIVFYDLGRAYQSVYRFEDAIDAFIKYKSTLTGPDMNYISADMQIEMCNRAIDMVKNPINVTFENLGSRINSPSPDYNAYVTKNEGTIYFTSKRNGNLGNLVDYDGYYTADLFVAENKYGNWDKPKRLPTTINTPLVEEMAGISSDGNMIFAFIDNLDASFQVRYAKKEGKSFQYLLPMGANINPNNEGATAVTLSPDKKTIIFAAERAGGVGGSDLYLSKLLPNGGWGPVQNLGKVINTKYDEDYPQLSQDGSRLYFSSIGHESIGGYDIFYSDWDTLGNCWGKPVNIGYPVNTPDDNTQISFTASGRYAYMSLLRPEGYGNLDIYRITFNDVEPAYTVLKGNLIERDSISVFEAYRRDVNKGIDTLTRVIDSASLAIRNLSDSTINIIKKEIHRLQVSLEKGPEVTVKVFDKKLNKVCGTYLPNPHTGRYAIVLKPGEFTVQVECEGYKPFSEDLKINDMEMSLNEINRNFVLNR
jgi:hypothetical protein